MTCQTIVFILNVAALIFTVVGAVVMFRYSKPSFGDPTFQDGERVAEKFLKEKNFVKNGFLVACVGFGCQFAALMLRC